jgi:hypothetical protein
MQTPLSVAEIAACRIVMTFDTKKTAGMEFSPCKRSLRIVDVFRLLYWLVAHYHLLFILNIWDTLSRIHSLMTKISTVK